MKNIFYYQSDFLKGTFGIAEQDGFITDVVLNESFSAAQVNETQLIKSASVQLFEYFAGERKVFDLPLMPEGTHFMKSIWEEIAGIPYGQTITYKQIAVNIGNPGAVRAVGSACRRNPIPIIIPCHRVLGSDGKLCGYNCGICLKARLLNLEGSI